MNTAVQKKFLKLKKTFVERISKDVNNSTFSSFCAFPPEISFNGQDESENIILMIRKHPITFLPQFILFLILLLSPMFLLSIFRNILDNGSFALWLGSSILFVLIAITVAVDTFFKWYYTVNIITDEKIIDVNFDNILFHSFAEAQLERIEDVSHKPIGIFSSIFDYGNVYIQTAGTKPEFVFDSVPRPRDVQDTLFDLIELKQEGKI
jgi:hypothetical protein